MTIIDFAVQNHHCDCLPLSQVIPGNGTQLEKTGFRSILIGANGSGSREEGSGLACWPPSLTGEPSLTVSMEDYWSLSRVGLAIENF